MSETRSAVLGIARAETQVVKHDNAGNGLLKLCGSCKKAISLEPGDLIYGGQWYHLACWNFNYPDHSAEMSTQDRLLEEHRAQLKF
jgi:hypothetical protein